MFSFWRKPCDSQLTKRLSLLKSVKTLIVALVMWAGSSLAIACPSLQSYYLQEQSAEQDPQLALQLEAELAAMMSQCLRSSEYFALFGAVQMRMGKLAEALETLERALLLDPDNGAAQIDYAQALYQRGQLFSALDLNGQILGRNDAPDNLRIALEQRDELWRSQTRQMGFQADLLAGYDDNLNGAPDPSQITLTLSGEPVLLPLSEEYRPQSGPYLNGRVAGRFTQFAPGHRHNGSAELRGRLSEDSQSDILQFDTRYAFELPAKDHQWRFNAGLAHLVFGGTSLYSASTIGAHYQSASSEVCSNAYGLELQHQLYHRQDQLDAVETRISAGRNCVVSLASWRSRIGLELALINNNSQGASRPGGDRQAWQASIDWQFPLYRGILSSQINYTNTEDDRGYSPVLLDDLSREVQRYYVLLQYRQQIGAKSSFLMNFFHQHQDSNIPLFDSLNTTLELGVNYRF
ncbi:MAG: tetratricopeptide repeat protein [Pseudohongiellaceae bacterium]|nr:tetratricopeptide repeat protein [Pseudohongiellaceae bacterium]